MLQSKCPWPAPDELARLVAAAQDARARGHTRAINALLVALRPALVAFFGAHGPPDTAEDLAQIALFRISTALPWIEADRADPFISTVARNLLRTAYRRRKLERRRIALDGQVVLADAAAGVTAADVHAEYEDLARAVHRVATSNLPPALRAVVLGILRNETPAEIAERLGISPVTVRTRLMRARAILRNELRAYLDRHEAPGCQDRVG